MGLDNGIFLQKRNPLYKHNEDIGHYYWIDEQEDVCYWRKFWPFRNKIITYLSDKYNEDCDGKETILDIDDLNWIFQEVETINNEKGFEAACNGYWDWEETGCQLIPTQIASLKALIELIKDDDKNSDLNYRVIFYDSY